MIFSESESEWNDWKYSQEEIRCDKLKFNLIIEYIISLYMKNRNSAINYRRIVLKKKEKLKIHITYLNIVLVKNSND